MSTDLVARFIHAAVGLIIIDLATNVADLNEELKLNRARIAELKILDPNLWHDLKARAEARRAALQAGGHLTPATARPSTTPLPPAVANRPADPTGDKHGQGQSSLFR